MVVRIVVAKVDVVVAMVVVSLLFQIMQRSIFLTTAFGCTLFLTPEKQCFPAFFVWVA